MTLVCTINYCKIDYRSCSILRNWHNEKRVQCLCVQVDMEVLSPRAVSSERLFGKYDPISADWKDGVLPCLFRAHAADTSPNLKWLVLDGPIGSLSIPFHSILKIQVHYLCSIFYFIINFAVYHSSFQIRSPFSK